MAAGQQPVPDDNNNQAVFGISLSSLPDSSLVPDIFVPKIVYDCVEFLRKHALRNSGLFRMAGFVQKRNIIREKLNRGIAVAFGEDMGAKESVSDCNTVADLLKRYLRELPEPPVPEPFFASYMHMVVTDGADISSSVSLLARLADTALPPLNYNLLKYVCLFLNNVALFHDENDMDAYNLAVIFTPNLLRLDEAPAPAELAKASTEWAKAEVSFVRCLVENADFIFCNPYQPPTRAHVKVVSNSPMLPPINMSTPISSFWMPVFEPLKNFRGKPLPTYRQVKYIAGPPQVLMEKEKVAMVRSIETSIPTVVASSSSNVHPPKEKQAEALKCRRLSQSLNTVAINEPVVEPTPLPPAREDARTMVSTVASRINMAESEMDKLKHDFTFLTRIGHV